MVDNWL